MKHCYLKRNLKFFAGCMCVWAMSAPITAQVLPDGMTRLTPEGLELGSVMSVANPLGPKEHAVRTENFLFFAGKDTEHGRTVVHRLDTGRYEVIYGYYSGI